MAIPFVRQFEFEYGRLDQLSPLVQRVIADNPGPFTYTGTGVYIIGGTEPGSTVAVIDPGPDTPAHREALWTALDGRHVSHVLVTHHHMDHSPLAAPLAKAHGCQVHGYGLQMRAPEGGEVRLEAGDDLSFRPDIEIRDGDTVKGDSWTLEALHTPGHTSNHLCFALLEENILFSGDHIMGWSTSVVSPPDGHMGDYLKSLERVKARNFDKIWPTHGTSIDAPTEFVSEYIAHRHAREAQILAAIKDGLHSISDMVAHIYQDVDKRLHPAAAHSVLAHLIHMEETERVSSDGAGGLKARWDLA
jgi:glyoxylase-like metal-dependent hydrolase (beta-lactamase superfamily II)